MPAAMILTLAVLFAATAFARIARNTIDLEAYVTDNGRQLILTGPIQVTSVGEKAFLHVTVSQRSTGAVAEGNAVVTGTGELQEWEIQADTLGREVFEEGPATAVAIARTMDNGQVTDAHQWLVGITIIKE